MIWRKGMEKCYGKNTKEYIIGFPTLLLLDSNGNVVHQMAGYQQAEDLMRRNESGNGGKITIRVAEKI